MLRTGMFDMLIENEIQVSNNVDLRSSSSESRLEKILTIEWLGQTTASICWITSVFTYGISSNGDWLQLLAASSWFLANISTVWRIQ